MKLKSMMLETFLKPLNYGQKNIGKIGYSDNRERQSIRGVLTRERK